MQNGKGPSFFWFASIWSGLQEEAKPGFHKSQVTREALCSDLLIIPQAVCVGETLSSKGLSWPLLCACQVLDKGTKRAPRLQCSGQPESPIFVQIGARPLATNQFFTGVSQ